jgi:MFS family permease
LGRRPWAVSWSARPAWPRWAAGLAWALWLLILLGLVATAWLDRLLRQAGHPQDAYLVAGNLPALVAMVTAVTVGALLASRRSRHPVGWLLLGLGLSYCLAAVTSSYSRYGLVARPGALPAAAWLVGIQNAMVVVWLSLAGFILLLTPTGTVPSPRWRWWARVAAAATVTGALAGLTSPRPLYPEHPRVGNALGVPALDGLFLPAALVVLVALVAGAGSLLGRFRRARGVERLQLRWLALAAAVSAAALLVAIATLALDGDTTLFQAALGAAVGLLPVATGAAILRYRLYDLDRIISRTVAYGLLTVLLGLGYAGVVLGLGRLLPDSSSLTVAAATLAVAAAFRPARRRIQQTVDRRFNRRRFDAAQTIAAFSVRLREQVDLNTLTGELLMLVQETMQPTQASLWLRPPAPSGSGHRGSRAG